MEIRTAYLNRDARTPSTTFGNDWDAEDVRRTVLENVMRPLRLDVNAGQHQTAAARAYTGRRVAGRSDVDDSPGPGLRRVG